MLELTKETFEQEVLKSKLPVIVDFWAPWCAPCGIVGPILEKLESEYTNRLKFSKLNVDENQDLAAQHGVRGIPCMVVFKEGKEFDRIVGALPESELRKKIDLALSNG